MTRIVSRMTATLWNRLQLMIGRAVLRAIDTGDGMHRAQVTLMRGEVRDGVPHFQPYGFTGVPLAGAYALAVFQGGRRDFGALAVVDDPRYRPTGWLAGEVGLWDHLGKFIRLHEDGTLEINAPKIVLNAAERIELNAGERLELSAGGDDELVGEIRVWAGLSYREDVAGHAEELRALGGATWQPENWKTGATIEPAIDNPIEPPKVSDA
jgi:phage baseplate assembly protein V